MSSSRRTAQEGVHLNLGQVEHDLSNVMQLVMNRSILLLTIINTNIKEIEYGHMIYFACFHMQIMSV